MSDKLSKIIGLQIFTNELRAVQLINSSGKIKVSAFGSVRLPEGTIAGGAIAKPEVFVQSLSEMFSKNNFNAKDIVVSISNQGLIMRLASFPKVTEDKQRNVIMLQAQNFIPIPLNELELSYFITDESVKPGENGEPGEPEINALLVAAKRDMLNNIVDTIQKAKFGYAVQDIVPSVTAITSEIQKSTRSRTYMVLNANNDVANILIVNGGRIAMARSIQFDTTLSDRFNHAEQPSKEDIDEMIAAIKAEYWSSINYYRISNSEDVETLYLSLQSINVEPMCREIAADLSVDVEVYSINQQIRAEERFPIALYSACVCAAVNCL